MNDRWLCSRRALLGGIGGATASTLLPGRAAGATPPRRFVVVHVPEGMWSGAPRPTASALGPILAPLENLRAHLLVLNNLRIASASSGPGGDGHHRNVPHMLTGTELIGSGDQAGGPSVDQKIARAIRGTTPFASLQFGVRIIYRDTNSRCIWADAGRVLPPMENPWDAYTRIFNGVMPSSAAPPPVSLRKSAIDFARADLAALAPRLPAADRLRLESYHDALRDIERRLATVTPPGCQPPPKEAMIDPRAMGNYPRIGQLQMDLMVAALQCDLTRVASLQWGNSNDQCTYPWLGINILGHNLSHPAVHGVSNAGERKTKVYAWYASQFAYLLGKLKATPEGAGTMLDSTVVLWVSEFGNSDGHSPTGLMWVLMGNVANRFRTGRVLDCGGRPVNDLHAALGQAYGIPDATFGNPRFCQGPLPNLT